LQGDTIPYVICLEKDPATGLIIPGGDKGLAERAFHPDEIKAPGSVLTVDADYYLSHQLLPVVSRLCTPIEGGDQARLAESLGLDGSKYRAAAAAAVGADAGDDALLGAGAGLDDDDRYRTCEPLLLTSTDGKAFEFAGVRALLKDTVAVDSALLPPEGGDSLLAPAQVANQVALRGREAVARYYEGRLRSDDETMPCETRDVCLRATGDVPPGRAPHDPRCPGAMRRVVGEAALYMQLSYYHRLFDVEGALRALGMEGAERRMAAEVKLAPVRDALEAGAAAAGRLRDSCGYRWVDLGSVFGSLAA
jgi:DNA polymerase alpha subunit A